MSNEVSKVLDERGNVKAVKSVHIERGRKHEKASKALPQVIVRD